MCHTIEPRQGKHVYCFAFSLHILESGSTPIGSSVDMLDIFNHVTEYRKELQKDFLGNRRNFWKKVKGKEAMHKWSLGIENEEGTLLTEQREVRNRWKDYFRGLFGWRREGCGHKDWVDRERRKYGR